MNMLAEEKAILLIRSIHDMSAAKKYVGKNCKKALKKPAISNEVKCH
jgi:hypothetical protein